MKRYIVYDNEGNILRYGRSSDRTFEDEKKSGLKIMEIPATNKGMDLTHQVNIDNMQSPKLILKKIKNETT